MSDIAGSRGSESRIFPISPSLTMSVSPSEHRRRRSAASNLIRDTCGEIGVSKASPPSDWVNQDSRLPERFAESVSSALSKRSSLSETMYARLSPTLTSNAVLDRTVTATSVDPMRMRPAAVNIALNIILLASTARFDMSCSDRASGSSSQTASIATSLATLPASWPPIPSATAAQRQWPSTVSIQESAPSAVRLEPVTARSWFVSRTSPRCVATQI